MRLPAADRQSAKHISWSAYCNTKLPHTHTHSHTDKPTRAIDDHDFSILWLKSHLYLWETKTETKCAIEGVFVFPSFFSSSPGDAVQLLCAVSQTHTHTHTNTHFFPRSNNANPKRGETKVCEQPYQNLRAPEKSAKQRTQPKNNETYLANKTHTISPGEEEGGGGEGRGNFTVSRNTFQFPF